MYGNPEFAAGFGLEALGEAATQGLHALGGAAALAEPANARMLPLPLPLHLLGQGQMGLLQGRVMC